MDFNLLQTIRDFITPDTVDRTANQLGESSSGVSKALSGAIPAVLGGLIQRAETGHAADVLRNATDAADTPGGLLGNTTALPTGDSWINNIFGNKQSGISTALASFAGIKSGSVQSLLGMVVPLILGVIGRHARTTNMSANGLTSFLTSQKSAVANAMPSGLNIGNLLGFNADTAAHTTNLRDTGTTVTRNVTTPDAPKRNWLWPILIGVAALLAIYLLSRGCNNTADTTVTDTDTVSQTEMNTPPVTTTADNNRTTTKIKLVDGTELDAYPGGIEERLVACLNDAGCKAGKDQWFDFDNINFETGSARLTAASQVQVNNLNAILKAYPKAEIKIGGYTDKTGNDAANKKLSEERAEAVTAALKAAGAADKQLLEPEGYGSQFAKVASTASDEERRADRRIAVQLRSK